MKHTLTTYEIAIRIHADEYAGFSYDGSMALAKYLEEMEIDSDTEMEFNAVKIRLEYAEYPSAFDWSVMYFGSAANALKELGSDSEEAACAFIKERGATLIKLEFSGGVIVSNF